MQLTYQFASADDINSDTIDAIKKAFKSKAITLMVQIAEPDEELSDDVKSVLDNRLEEDVATYLSSEESITLLRKKYAV
jgi:hypothetical protein